MFRIIDNRNSGIVGDVLKNEIQEGAKLSILAAHLSIYAYKELRDELSTVDSVRFLFTEPTFTNEEEKNQQKREFLLKKNYREKSLAGNEYEIALKNELNQGAIAKEFAGWIKENVEIKSVKDIKDRPQIMFKGISIQNESDESVIQGSLDFDASGLGYAPSPAYVMNQFAKDKITTQQFVRIFNEFWNNEAFVEDVKAQVLESVQTMYKENTPEFIYFVTLYNIFKEYLDEFDEDKIIKGKTGFKNTTVWNKLYKFQKDGVLGAIEKLERYNGCVIADSVGLGKTFEALAVIKYYELRNDRVLVLCPKKLRDNWTLYTQNDTRNILLEDRFRYDVLNHTDLSRTSGMSGSIDLRTINWGNYDLVVIDESHNFRNNQARNDKETRYSRLMKEIIKKGVNTKVLLLSATPVNNKMNDIKNQIAFITEGDDKHFEDEGIKSIEATLRKAQMIFNKWVKLQEEDRTTQTFLEMINFDYFKLLDTITIARSRKHIEKYYNMSEIGKFPERLKPRNIHADIDTQGSFEAISSINKKILRLNLAVYSPLQYVLPQKREVYSEKYDIKVQNGKSVFKQTDREQSIVHLMRVNLLKRLESSINSFTITLERILYQVEKGIAGLEKNISPELEDLSIDDINNDEQLSDLLVGNKVKVLISDVDRIRWKQDLLEDKEILSNLLKEAKKISVERDAKLEKIKEVIQNKIEKPINPGNKKVIIFTAFADTAKYLYENINKWAYENYNVHSALITGGGGNKTNLPKIKADMSDILINFSPKSKERSKVFENITGEIDILIATDCISEGQNLQDTDFLINYDIHWNPVRIIQRFGRIDRLGSKNDKIQLVNFWPHMELDEYINLEARVSGRMILLDVSATGEENVIEYDENKKMNDLDYRKKQLKQLQESVLNLEDVSGGISITDLTMNDFKMDLLEYMKDNKRKLEKAPMGMYAVSSLESSGLNEEIRPGVIYCLKQTNDNELSEEYNSLHPYYMIYVYEDGEIEYNYVHTKQILDFYKKLSNGKSEIEEDLVKIFNKETRYGRNMTKYTDMLDKAINNILGKQEEVSIQSIFSLGESSILYDNNSSKEDFELISFLVIK
ncbi:MAG: helicase-related protein [Paraclostridium sordellii]